MSQVWLHDGCVEATQTPTGLTMTLTNASSSDRSNRGPGAHSAEPPGIGPLRIQAITVRTIAISMILDLFHDRRDRTSRKYFEHETAIMRDLKQSGIRTPIKVVPEGDKYRLVCGQTRTNACRRAGLAEIPAIILGELSPSEMLLTEWIDNQSSESFSLLAQAEIFGELMRVNGFTLNCELSAKFPAIKQPQISRAFAVFGNLNDQLKALHREGTVGSRLAVALARLPKDAQFAMYDAVKDMKVEVAEAKVATSLGKISKPKPFVGQSQGTQIKFFDLQGLKACHERLGISLKKLRPGEGPEDFLRHFES